MGPIVSYTSYFSLDIKLYIKNKIIYKNNNKILYKNYIL